MNEKICKLIKYYFKFYKKKNVFILCFLIFLIFYHYSYLSKLDITIKSQNKKKIFSFWHPLEKIPGYICLCIKTWEKFLPQYEIIILDYNGVKEYIGESLFNDIICKEMSLPIQADAIRVALLNKYGGIWMDADTIITNGEFLNNLEKYELSMFGRNNSQHIIILFIYRIYICFSKFYYNKRMVKRDNS